MKNLVLRELEKELSWKERIILKIFTKTIVKIYNKGLEKGVNAVL